MFARPRPFWLLSLVGAVVFGGVAKATSIPAAPLNSYRFTALYETVNARGQRVRQVADFTPEGPIAGTILPANLNQSHLAVDPRGPTYYAGSTGRFAVRVDPVTGATTDLAGPDPELVDWPTGLTFDTKHHQVVQSTLGGEGFLIAYFPELHQWARRTSLDQADIYSLTYSAEDDAFYALTGASGLVRYTPNGVRTASIPLDPQLPQSDWFDVQLIAVGDRLVLLTPPPHNSPLPTPDAVQHSYLIDPHTGAVTSLGAVHVVPEPCALATGCVALALALSRRRR